VTTIAALDVPRYMGTWYEIAKFPNRFQAKCVANTRAHYVAQADGSVQVRNSCTTADGSSTDHNRSPSRFQWVTVQARVAGSIPLQDEE
jgi:lipocalin